MIIKKNKEYENICDPIYIISLLFSSASWRNPSNSVQPNVLTRSFDRFSIAFGDKIDVSQRDPFAWEVLAAVELHSHF